MLMRQDVLFDFISREWLPIWSNLQLFQLIKCEILKHFIFFLVSLRVWIFWVIVLTLPQFWLWLRFLGAFFYKIESWALIINLQMLLYTIFRSFFVSFAHYSPHMTKYVVSVISFSWEVWITLILRIIGWIRCWPIASDYLIPWIVSNILELLEFSRLCQNSSMHRSWLVLIIDKQRFKKTYS